MEWDKKWWDRGWIYGFSLLALITLSQNPSMELKGLIATFFLMFAALISALLNLGDRIETTGNEIYQTNNYLHRIESMLEENLKK